MPSKKAHRVITAAGGVVLFPLLFFIEPQHFACLEAGVAITLVPEMGPDLDVNNRRFGAIGEFIGLKGYSKVVPHRYGLRKRHWHNLRVWNIFFFSHIPFLGTIPRALILVFPVFAISMITNNVSVEIFIYFLFLYLGMGISDSLHVTADVFYSFIKGKVAFKEMDRGYWTRRKNRGVKKYGKKKPRNEKYGAWF